MTRFDQFKLKKAGDVKIMTLKIEGKLVVIDKEFGKDTKWDTFMNDHLPNDDCRYVVLDYDYQTVDGRESDKIILISWCPSRVPGTVESIPRRRVRRAHAAFRRRARDSRPS